MPKNLLQNPDLKIGFWDYFKAFVSRILTRQFYENFSNSYFSQYMWGAIATASV